MYYSRSVRLLGWFIFSFALNILFSFTLSSPPKRSPGRISLPGENQAPREGLCQCHGHRSTPHTDAVQQTTRKHRHAAHGSAGAGTARPPTHRSGTHSGTGRLVDTEGVTSPLVSNKGSSLMEVTRIRAMRGCGSEPPAGNRLRIAVPAQEQPKAPVHPKPPLYPVLHPKCLILSSLPGKHIVRT